MGDIISFKRRRPPREVADFRTAIEGALAVALDTVDTLIAVLDDIEGAPSLDGADEDRPPNGSDDPVSTIGRVRGADALVERTTL